MIKLLKPLIVVFGLLSIVSSATNACFSDQESVAGNNLSAASWENKITEARIVINEVYYDPDYAHGDMNDEWIELYNAGNVSVNLKDWYLEDNMGAPDKEIIHQTYIIEPGQFVLISANANIWSKYWDLVPENSTKIALGGTRMFSGLGNNGDRVALKDSDGSVVDQLSYGTDKTIFDPSASDVAKGHSISRNATGLDTDMASDFSDLAIPTPGK